MAASDPATRLRAFLARLAPVDRAQIVLYLYDAASAQAPEAQSRARTLLLPYLEKTGATPGDMDTVEFALNVAHREGITAAISAIPGLTGEEPGSADGGSLPDVRSLLVDQTPEVAPPTNG